MKKIFVLMFLFIQTICFSQDWLKPYDYFVEAGWVVPNGFHVGWGVWYTYFGFNVFGGKESVLAKPTLITDGTIEGTKTVSKGYPAETLLLQIPLGFQYAFGEDPFKTRFGFRVAWLPTILYLTTPNLSYGKGDYWNFLGKQYYWTGHEWIEQPQHHEDFGFRAAAFELSGTMSFSNCLYFSLSAILDFQVFADSRAVASIGYSFSRYVAKGKKKS